MHHVVDDVAAVSSLKIVLSQVLTVTASSAYAAGDVVGSGGVLTFANAVRTAPDGVTARTGGKISSVLITDKSNNQASFDIWFFDSNPTATTFTDKTLLTLNTADIVRSIGFVTVNAWSGANSGGGVGQGLLDLPFVLASGTTLYAVLITRGTPTFASTTDVQVRLVISQD
jgi:hypothetical protein